MTRIFVLILLLTLGACAHTSDPPQPGWIPADEWQARIDRVNAGAEAYDPRDDLTSRYTGTRPAEGSGPSGVYIPRARTVRTYCYSYKRYTRCTSY